MGGVGPRGTVVEGAAGSNGRGCGGGATIKGGGGNEVGGYCGPLDLQLTKGGNTQLHYRTYIYIN